MSSEVGLLIRLIIAKRTVVGNGFSVFSVNVFGKSTPPIRFIMALRTIVGNVFSVLRVVVFGEGAPIVCRVCLAMSVKMHHMSEHNLTTMYKQVTGVEISKEDKLPQMLCWECVARLTSSNHFKEKALRTQWILLSKLIDDKCITLSDIESIDRAQYQLESTLGFKYDEVDNSDVHIVRESDGEAYNADDEANKIEEMFINPNNERVTIKSEYLEETEQHDEADFQMPIVIPKKEISSDEEVTVDEVPIEVKLEERDNGTVEQEQQFSVMPLSNQRSEELSHVKELSVDLEDIMLTSKHFTQDPLTQFTDQLSMVTHPQIKEEILDNYVDKITINIPSVSNTNLQEYAASQNVFICDICDKQFNVKGTLTRHLKKHPRMHTCSLCTYRAYKTSDIKRHIDCVHSKNLSLNCSYCSYKAYDKRTLTRHVNVKHTKTVVYDCSLCSYKAYDKSTLTKHVNVKHTKTTVYSCTFCSYTAYEKRYLTTHVNAKHTKTIVYKCSYCIYKTYHQSDLSKHVNAQHTKKISYNCSLCDYITYHRSHLSNHINVKHTKNISYICNLCNYKTYHRSALSKHIKAKHSKK